MSIYRIDGYVLSVPDLYKWIGSFIAIYRMGKIPGRIVPNDILESLKNSNDEKVVQAILAYLKNDEEFIGELINIVREKAPEVAEQHLHESKAGPKSSPH